MQPAQLPAGYWFVNLTDRWVAYLYLHLNVAICQPMTELKHHDISDGILHFSTDQSG